MKRIVPLPRAARGPPRGFSRSSATFERTAFTRTKRLLRLPSDRLGDARLAASRRTVEDEGAEPVLGDEAREQAARPQEWSWPTISARRRGRIRTAKGRGGPPWPASAWASGSGSLNSSLWSAALILEGRPLSAESPRMRSHFRRVIPGAIADPPVMKSAYELAMERLAKDDPTSARSLTPEMRARLAEIDRVYLGRIAEREIFLRQQLEKALAGTDAEEVGKVRQQMASEKARLEEEREAEKERVRAGKA